MTQSVPVKDEAQAARRKQMAESIRADQPARFSVALISDAAKAVTGQIFGVSGENIILYSQPRPIETVSKPEGWTDRDHPLRSDPEDGGQVLLPRKTAAAPDARAGQPRLHPPPESRRRRHRIGGAARPAELFVMQGGRCSRAGVAQLVDFVASTYCQL